MEHRAFKLVDTVCHRYTDNGSTEIKQHRKELSDTQKELEGLLLSQSDDSELENQIEKLRRRETNLKQDLVEKERMNSYSVVVGLEEFESLTMKLLTLAKDALVYLSLAIHHEELKKPQEVIAIPMQVPKK
jgi:hypothetical protein